jgi:5-methylthioadenosine/S-adenosylhomocysteine deaminase
VLLEPDLLFADGVLRAGLELEVDVGRIARVGAATGRGRRLPGRALLPGTVNAHNHSFQSLVRGFGDDMRFADWRDRGIYRYSLGLGPGDVYVGALFAFGEMLTYGVTTVADFFYLHDQGNDNAHAVIRAARDLGIRLVLARAFYDWPRGPAKYRESPDDASRRCRELMAAVKGDPLVAVQPAPHSPHAASPAMIEAGAALSAETGAPCHVHVAEAPYEVEQTKAEHGTTPLRYLERHGAVTPRTLAVHGCWLDDGEWDLMAERGARLAYNPSSNMFLGDGVTPLRKALSRGITVALGTDGGCSNNQVSVFTEMRMAALLQKVAALDSTALTAAEAFRMGTEGGGVALDLPVGRLASGYRGDLVTVDLEHLSLQPPQRAASHLVYALDPRAIREVYVEGRLVFADGDLTTVPVRRIVEQVRRVTAGW